ncbi:hypothetical protein GGQ74_001658 [Desulfobaculum xiamenense]|uniref:Uncharacterized protein n=1 Tax=Desulfobaculum xiamenense TaxID=995050 RepID=A0A846QRI1_9BACT|nr:hypothetical protein [Desulfobaculum xiamenense]NJB67985.1 hypothetical protein [Desulfobaculum xiamenense]
MSRLDDNLKFVFDAKGECLGVWISPELWNRLDSDIMPLVERIYPGCVEEPVKPEPIKEWETLKQYWDFPYPIDTMVHCDLCGASTEDWEADEPRVFRLKSANLGGLATFECQHCKALVTKRHFKDKITFEFKAAVKK